MHVRRVIEEVWNQRNFAVVDELVANSYTGHQPRNEAYGIEGYKQFFVRLCAAFPDLHFTIEDQIAEGDRVMTRWTARGTHEAEFQGIPPTGKQGAVMGTGIYRLANGKIVEGWTNVDELGMLRQLGVLAAPRPTKSLS